MSNNSAIEVKNVTFGYDKSNIAVLDVSFTVKEGSSVMLIGPNGSGKTTLLKLMIGLLDPTHGKVKVYGKTPSGSRDIIGYVPQKLDFDQTFPLTVHELLELSHKKSGNSIEKSLDNLGIKHLSKLKIGTLSVGQLQRVLIARSLLDDPKILYLDEPASGIDAGGEHSFYQLIKSIQKERGVTVIMVSHQIQLVTQFADQVVCINKKMLSSGVPEKELTREMVQKLFGEKVAFHEHNH